MKTILTTLILSLSTLLLSAQSGPQVTNQETEGTTITVNVPVKSDKGTVLIALQDEATFMRQGIANLESEIVDGQATVTFKNVQPGTYAVLLFHDTNGNKQMDFEPNGMPKEMYGVSNNVMSMGPPQWNDAKFEVTNEPITLDIRL